MKQPNLFADMERTAWLSPCGRYRHTLGRHWNRAAGFALFVGLNPSKADAEHDDPSTNRVVRFARDWGFGGVEWANLYDWRSTDPKALPCPEIAVSDKNDACMRRLVAEAKFVVAAWGAVPWASKRIDDVFRNVFSEEKRWHALKLTKHGFPQHPLYVPASVKPVVFW